MLEIKYLPSFQQELNAIIDYIIFTLEAPKAALNLIDELEKLINKLIEIHRIIYKKRNLSQLIN